MSEPAVWKTGPTTAPETWNSAFPEAVGGAAETREGGTSFNDATALEQGVWRDGVGAGQTLFYRVPVDWGQQLYATAELDGAVSGDGFLGNALVMSLYNPVRAFVEDADTGYDGTATSAVLEPLPSVAHENRYAVDDRVNGMRFAGWYYLAVHLGAKVADKFGEGPFELTLRVRLSGTGRAGPVYAGQAAPHGVFDVTDGDRRSAASGVAGGHDGRDKDTLMKLVAAGGIGAGSALVLGLGVWTVAARRRAGAPATAGNAASRQYESPVGR